MRLAICGTRYDRFEITDISDIMCMWGVLFKIESGGGFGIIQ